MYNLYDFIEYLAKRDGENITKMCSELHIPRTALSELKANRVKSLNANYLNRIAERYRVSNTELLFHNLPLLPGTRDFNHEDWRELEPSKKIDALFNLGYIPSSIQVEVDELSSLSPSVFEKGGLDALIKDEPMAAYGEVKDELTEDDKKDIAKLIMLRAELNRGNRKKKE